MFHQRWLMTLLIMSLAVASFGLIIACSSSGDDDNDNDSADDDVADDDSAGCTVEDKCAFEVECAFFGDDWADQCPDESEAWLLTCSNADGMMSCICDCLAGNPSCDDYTICGDACNTEFCS